MSHWIIFPFLLLLSISKSSRQNEEGRTAAKNFRQSSLRPNRAASIYREHFETYESQQMHRNWGTEEVGSLAQQREQQTKEENGGIGTTGTRSSTRYMEVAETEFSRPSSYFPVPFVTSTDNRLQAIPARTLSQLIRQHIARNRMKQLAAAHTPVDYLQSRVKELRQTPFRRWPSNSTVLSYAEKRRQWKAELKRRLKEQKVRPRIIPPFLISGGGYSSILTDREPENRYFVTYSPQTRTYQVSRHPPPYLYTTDQDTLPQQLEEMPSQQINTDPVEHEQQAVTEGSATAPPSADIVTKSSEETTVDNAAAEDEHASIEEMLSTTLPTPQESGTETMATTVRPPLLLILQNAELMPITQKHEEHIQRVEAIKTGQDELKPLKQILFLDDYDQIQGDEEGNEMDNAATNSNNNEKRLLTIAGKPLSESDRKTASNEATKGGGTVVDQNKAEEWDQFSEEENEDEDLFFFKPSSERWVGEKQNSGERRGDPFRIVVHETGRKL